ncbi:DUF4136 domain-containing protein [Xanthovirga aplysinae]|uniref:DUF4136 domain-containing protein n=1 Tax=Xanthovirga aplysinae TaxID=2529853 RepID=UPI0012BBAC0D|nr:DUF4136 domain-containing protein [Xanthovirga aplysinae]MTI31629.1 DUF4136 domain-containing protein [Xanthovirga aplysinae]
MRKIWNKGILLIIFSFTACINLKKVHVNYDKYTDFSRYMSFSWHVDAGENGQISSLIDSQLKRTVETELLERGFAYNPHDPDLLVCIKIKIEKKTDYRAVPTGSGGYYGHYNGGHNYTMVPYVYYERTTTLRLIDKKGMQTIWEGALVAIQKDNLSRRYKRIQKGLNQIIRKFDFRGSQQFY